MIDKLLSAAPDLAGVGGLCMIGAGIWIGYGSAPALIVTGALMLTLGVAAAWKGSR